MSHSCASMLCIDDHYGEGYCTYWEDCSHEICHEDHHDFKTWAVYPTCPFCEEELLTYWEDELSHAA